VHELNWFWIGIAIVAPSIAALLVAFLFWRKGQMVFGSIAGTAIIFATAVGLILREYVELDAIVQDCLDAGGEACFPEPTAFMRFAIYACIGLAEVFALFTLSLVFEERVRRRDYAPEWRR
jgi:hypothetical protein